MKKFFYRVGKNEDLLDISVKLKVPQRIIVFENKLSRQPEEGDILYIEKPDGEFIIVSPYETINSLAKKYGKSEERILAENCTEYVFFGQQLIV